MPPDVIVPTADDPPATPFTDHITDVFALPVTVAAKDRLAPKATLAVEGVRAIDTVGTATCRFTELPITIPGAGCCTLNWIDPTCDAVPLTTNLVGETYVVGIATPFANTTESAAKFAPLKLTV